MTEAEIERLGLLSEQLQSDPSSSERMIKVFIDSDGVVADFASLWG